MNAKPRDNLGLILPWDVRYALRYREAHLGVSEVRLLADSGFEHEAAYLAIKAGFGNLTLQQQLLSMFIKAVRGAKQMSSTDPLVLEALRGFVHECCDMLPRDCTVPAEKLAQLSRQGFDFWQKKYQNVAPRCAADDRMTYLVGHATFVGLAAFVLAHDATRKEFRLVMLDYVLDPDLSTCGFSVGEQIDYLPKSFERTPALIVDDMKRTGTCMRKVSMLWCQDIPGCVPDFEFLGVVAADAVNGS